MICFLKQKTDSSVLAQRIRGHSFMASAKKVENSGPTQQSSDVEHSSVLQWTYTVTYHLQKNGVWEFFPKTLAIRSTHSYKSFFLR